MAVSSWCETELTSALGLKIRTSQLTAHQAEAVLFTYQNDMAPALEQFPLEERDLLNACLLYTSDAADE